jgi:hypothetical protein
MTTTNIARLQDRVRIAAPGSLDGVIRLEAYDALKEFFARTDAWLFELPVYVTPETNDYQIDTCQNAIVQRLMSLERPRSPPPPEGPWPPAYLPMCPPQYFPVSESSNQPVESQNPLFRTRRNGILLNAGAKCPFLRIDLNPNVAEIWVATLSLNICDPMAADGFAEPPDWVMEKWGGYIASGVITRLMLQPGKPYSSLPGAGYHGRKFNEGVGLARTEVRRMFNYGAQRWNYPSGWNSPRPRLPYGSTLL